VTKEGYIDSELSASESNGDQGAIFANFVKGNELRDRDLASLQQQDDSTRLINITGQQFYQVSDTAGSVEVGNDVTVSAEVTAEGSSTDNITFGILGTGQGEVLAVEKMPGLGSGTINISAEIPETASGEKLFFEAEDAFTEQGAANRFDPSKEDFDPSQPEEHKAVQVGQVGESATPQTTIDFEKGFSELDGEPINNPISVDDGENKLTFKIAPNSSFDSFQQLPNAYIAKTGTPITAIGPRDGENTEIQSEIGQFFLTDDRERDNPNKDYLFTFDEKPVSSLNVDILDVRLEGRANVGDQVTLKAFSSNSFSESNIVGSDSFTIQGDSPDPNRETLSITNPSGPIRAASIVNGTGDGATGIDNITFTTQDDNQEDGTTIDFEEGFSDKQKVVEPVEVANNEVTFSIDSGQPAFIAKVGPPRTAFGPDDAAPSGAGSFFLTDERGSESNLSKRGNYSIDFNQPVSRLSVDILDFRVEGITNVGDSVILRAFSDSGSVVGSDSFNIIEGLPDPNLETLSIVNPDSPISSAVIINEANDAGTGIDNITFHTSETNNEPPQVETPISDRDISEGQSSNFNVSDAFSDPDGDNLTYQISSANSDNLLPPVTGWLDIDQDTGEVTAEPEQGDDGSYALEVTAKDPEGKTASSQFVLTVDNDDESAGVTIFDVGSDGLSLVENGQDASYKVVLDSKPTEEVTIEPILKKKVDNKFGGIFKEYNDNNVNVIPTDLNFTPNNWDKPQTISVSASDGAPDNLRVDYAVSSQDQNYDDLIVKNTKVSISDQIAVSIEKIRECS